MNLPKSVDFELQVYELSNDLIGKLGLTPKISKVSLQVSLTGHTVHSPENGPLKIYFSGIFTSFTYLQAYGPKSPSSNAPKDKFSTKDSLVPDLPNPKSNKNDSTSKTPAEKSTYGGYKTKALPTPPKKELTQKSKGKETLLAKKLFPSAPISDDEIINLDKEDDENSDESDKSLVLTAKTRKRILPLDSVDSDAEKEEEPPKKVTPKRKTRSSSK
ncbi:hypothetical protein HDU76_010964 [Blyttiomyces sp. JEL0837]|nr:hypothetical protein HDU76_010964 [Blyttiomyces sp. JEL0837]